MMPVQLALQPDGGPEAGQRLTRQGAEDPGTDSFGDWMGRALALAALAARAGARQAESALPPQEDMPADGAESADAEVDPALALLFAQVPLAWPPDGTGPGSGEGSAAGDEPAGATLPVQPGAPAAASPLGLSVAAPAAGPVTAEGGSARGAPDPAAAALLAPEVDTGREAAAAAPASVPPAVQVPAATLGQGATHLGDRRDSGGDPGYPGSSAGRPGADGGRPRPVGTGVDPTGGQPAALAPASERAGPAPGEAAHAPPPGTPVRSEPLPLLDQLAGAVRASVRQGGNEVVLSLEPEHLGKVAVRLVMQDGALHAETVVAHAAVRELIESGLPQLRERLAGQGLEVGGFAVHVGGERSSREQRQEQQDAAAQGGGRLRVRPAQLAPGAGGGPGRGAGYRWSGISRLIDLRA